MGLKRSFLERNGLPEHYLQQASIWFDPIVETIFEHQTGAGKTIVVGINGCQGSGKTTLADYLCIGLERKGLKSIAISIDDFYLTRKERKQLATDVHPLFSTRGVPGTHDLDLAINTLNHLAQKAGEVKVPKFNKAQDERLPIDEWPQVEAPLDVIVLEGWCVGITAEVEESLLEPINELEADRDPSGTWRNYINKQLVSNYPDLWKLMDRLIMLQAPSFSCVYKWRLEQEQKLAQKEKLKEGSDEAKNKIMEEQEIRDFIQHYERLTRHSLKYLPKICQHLFQLTTKRQVTSYQAPNPLPGDPRYGVHNVSLTGIL